MHQCKPVMCLNLHDGELILLVYCVCSVLQASSWVEQEQLDERLTDMEAQKAQLAADLQATQVRAALLGTATDGSSCMSSF